MQAAGAHPELSAEDVERLRAACRRPVVDPRDGLFASESFIRRVNREAVVLLGGGRALLLQIAHPLVAAAVAAHSRFRAEPLARLWRTLDLMLTIVFADAAHALAAVHEIERVHARVHGVLDADVGPWRRGTPYDANDPTLLLWVHATLVDSALLVYGRFVAPLSPEDRATYYEESKVGARLLGIPDALVPPSHRAFEDYVDAMVRDDVLTVGETARDLAASILAPPLPLPLGEPFRVARFVTIGLLPSAVRTRYGLVWRATHERLLDALAALTRPTLRFLPECLRLLPHARRGRWS